MREGEITNLERHSRRRKGAGGREKRLPVFPKHLFLPPSLPTVAMISA